MRSLIKVVFFIMAIVPAEAAEAAPINNELNSIMMETTFLISGPSKKENGKAAIGTGFILGKPAADGSTSYFVLVTAAHVFEDIDGDTATINPRIRQPDGSYVAEARTIKIRTSGKKNYAMHSQVDVAAIYVGLPEQFAKIAIVSQAVLATDADLKKYEIHPGDELLCLGYPLGAAGPHGFPILRSGKIASFPLIPAQTHRNWWFDFRVFGGNSGGPVYFVDRSRSYGGETRLGETIQIMIGLVTSQVSADSGAGPRELQLGVVIPALFIRETMDMLPAAPPG